MRANGGRDREDMAVSDYFFFWDGAYQHETGRDWIPLYAEVQRMPEHLPAELLDNDRMPLGQTWTLPPDYTLWQKVRNFLHRLTP